MTFNFYADILGLWGAYGAYGWRGIFRGQNGVGEKTKKNAPQWALWAQWAQWAKWAPVGGPGPLRPLGPALGALAGPGGPCGPLATMSGIMEWNGGEWILVEYDYSKTGWPARPADGCFLSVKWTLLVLSSAKQILITKIMISKTFPIWRFSQTAVV